MKKVYLILLFIGLVFLFPTKAEAKLCKREQSKCGFSSKEDALPNCTMDEVLIRECKTSNPIDSCDECKWEGHCKIDSSCSNGGGGGNNPTVTPIPTVTPGGPTPTPNPLCKCNAVLKCTPQCQFNKFTTSEVPGISYGNPIKCGLPNGRFQSIPTADQKNDWCRSEMRTKGDADGNGNATLKDYFYYVAAIHGDKIPPTVNPDFDGDNTINGKDRAIIIKSLTTRGLADE